MTDTPPLPDLLSRTPDELQAELERFFADRRQPAYRGRQVARWLYDTLRGRVGDPARLMEVRVFESPDLGSVYPG